MLRKLSGQGEEKFFKLCLWTCKSHLKEHFEALEETLLISSSRVSSESAFEVSLVKLWTTKVRIILCYSKMLCSVLHKEISKQPLDWKHSLSPGLGWLVWSGPLWVFFSFFSQNISLGFSHSPHCIKRKIPFIFTEVLNLQLSAKLFPWGIPHNAFYCVLPHDSVIIYLLFYTAFADQSPQPVDKKWTQVIWFITILCYPEVYADTVLVGTIALLFWLLSNLAENTRHCQMLHLLGKIRCQDIWYGPSSMVSWLDTLSYEVMQSLIWVVSR